MGGLVAALATVAGLLSRSVACTPRICDGCGRTVTSLTPAQCADVRSGRLAACRRRRCGGRLWPVWPHAYRDTFTRALSAEETRLSRTAAPGADPEAAAKADHLEGTPAMTIISRHARDLHAGDVITRDPDHDRPVRWRVSRPAEVTGDGVAIIDYVDLPSSSNGIAYFGGLVEVAVEPVGGAR